MSVVKDSNKNMTIVFGKMGQKVTIVTGPNNLFNVTVPFIVSYAKKKIIDNKDSLIIE